MEYFGAREVSVPCTTADTHSAPNLAFQYGTRILSLNIELTEIIQYETYNSVEPLLHLSWFDLDRRVAHSPRKAMRTSPAVQ